MQTTYRYFEQEEVALDDGSDFTRAVFRRCSLVYAGGELRLDGAMFFDCSIAFRGTGEGAKHLQAAIFASLYAQGCRTLYLEADGSYRTEP